MSTHTLERTDDGWRCSICLWNWKRSPVSRCPGVPRMSAAWLLTYTQLHKKGLKPVDRDKPDACYYQSSSKEFIWLYDERQALPRRKETEAQKEGHKRAWATTQEQYRCTKCQQAPDSLADVKNFHKGGLCETCAYWLACEEEQREIEEYIEKAHHKSVTWAREMLGRDDWCILDTETTDLSGYIIEIGIVDPSGRVLFESRVDPRTSITAEASAVNGIRDADLIGKPTLPEVWDLFMDALAGRTTIIAYNAAFDKGILQSDAARYNLPLPQIGWDCLMLRYSAWFGEWSDYHGDFKWQRLPEASHAAIEDTRAAIRLIQRMAR